MDDHAIGEGVCRNETLEVSAQDVAETAPGPVAGTSEQRAFRLVVVHRVDAQADVLLRVQDRDVVLDPAEHFIAQVPMVGIDIETGESRPVESGERNAVPGVVQPQAYVPAVVE